jgi:hypothetical protein
MSRRSWLERFNGRDFRADRWSDEELERRRGETGAVIALRYPAVGQFGLAPERSWWEARVLVDGHLVCTASTSGPGVRWLPLLPGSHEIVARSAKSGEMLAALKFQQVPGPMRVNVYPRGRRGLIPGYRDGRIELEAGGKT